MPWFPSLVGGRAWTRSPLAPAGSHLLFLAAARPLQCLPTGRHPRPAWPAFAFCCGGHTSEPLLLLFPPPAGSLLPRDKHPLCSPAMALLLPCSSRLVLQALGTSCLVFLLLRNPQAHVYTPRGREVLRQSLTRRRGRKPCVVGPLLGHSPVSSR